MEREKKQLTKEEKRKEIWSAIKYTLIAASAGIIEYGSFSLLTLIPQLQPQSIYYVPATISLILSVIWNLTFNRKYTFQSANNIKIAILQTIAYYLVFGPLSIWLAQMYLIDTLGWNEFLVKAAVMVINFVTEFLYQRFYVFKNSLDTKPVTFKKKKKAENSEKEDA